MIFNALDGLIILGLGAGAFWGFNRGILREIIDFLCLYLATVTTTLLFQKPAKWLALRFRLPLPFMEITIFALLLIALFFVFLYIALDLLRPPQRRYLSLADRTGGMVFGLLFALLLMSILLFFLDYALDVNWFKLDHYRRAIFETRLTSFAAPVVEESGKALMIILKVFFPKSLPKLFNP